MLTTSAIIAIEITSEWIDGEWIYLATSFPGHVVGEGHTIAEAINELNRLLQSAFRHHGSAEAFLADKTRLPKT